jgi:hypothetical protein
MQRMHGLIFQEEPNCSSCVVSIRVGEGLNLEMTEQYAIGTAGSNFVGGQNMNES